MELPEHIVNKIMLYVSHPVADLLKEYKERWYKDYQEMKGHLPYEYYFAKDFKCVWPNGADAEEVGNEDLWGKRVLRFYEIYNDGSIDSYDQKLIICDVCGEEFYPGWDEEIEKEICMECLEMKVMRVRRKLNFVLKK